MSYVIFKPKFDYFTKVIKKNQTWREKFILNILVFHIKPRRNVETRDKCTTAQIFDGSD